VDKDENLVFAWDWVHRRVAGNADLRSKEKQKGQLRLKGERATP
jgi:hypothetical protein